MIAFVPRRNGVAPACRSCGCPERTVWRPMGPPGDHVAELVCLGCWRMLELAWMRWRARLRKPGADLRRLRLTEDLKVWRHEN